MGTLLICLALSGLPQVAPPLSPGQAPPRDTRPPNQSSDATIRGRVIAADTGRPLRSAVVRATAPNPRGGALEGRVVTTDAEGRYELTELAAGRYSLSAAKGTYVTLSYGQLRPFESGKPLEIRAGQTIERVDFALPRGAVMAGRIFDEFGDPVAALSVTVMRSQYIDGRRQLNPYGSATTNDLGEYRIFGLPPGQYYVSAAQRGVSIATLGRPQDNSIYVPTYYPGTLSPAEAQQLTLGIGQTINEINISVVAARAARVSGTVVTSDGQPMAGASLSLGQFWPGGGSFGTSGSTVRPDGTFVIFSLAPGEYTLSAAPSGMGGPPGGFTSTTPSEESASIKFTVSGEDITDLRLVGVKPIGITGKVLIDGDPASLRASLSTLRIFASSVQPDERGGSVSAPIKDDLTFELKVRPGKLRFAVSNFGAAGTQPALKAVRWRGVDITDSGAEFRPGEGASGVEVELTNTRTDLSGVVTDNRGAPAKDYTIVVFALDRERWGNASRYQGTARPDQNGRFRIRGLPAGDYYAIAVDYLEPGAAGDPEFLESVRQKATPLSLGDGETKTLDLRVQSGT